MRIQIQNATFCFRLTVENVETYMVVMRNVFSSHMKIHKKYDLKGSTIDREVSSILFSGCRFIVKGK
jgi:hypothetical protein